MEKIISTFESIRDIPYWIGNSEEDPGIACVKKHIHLKEKLENLGVSCRFRSCVFHWDKLPLPLEILEISHDEICDHTFLEVLINGEWQTIDATWDNGLQKKLPTSKWDGKKSTPIAMPVDKIFSVEESEQMVESWTPERITNDLERNGKFYMAINNWLTKIRL